MPDQIYLELQKSEGIVAQCATMIYCAYVTRGDVRAGNEKEWIDKSIHEALQIAYYTDERVQSDTEKARRDPNAYE